MQIHSLQTAQAAYNSTARGDRAPQAGGSQAAAGLSQAADQLELSEEAQQISRAQGAGANDSVSNAIRTEKVAAIRQAIADGTYETPENMSLALDRLLDTLA